VQNDSTSATKPSYPISSVDNALKLLRMFGEQPWIRVSTASTELGVVRSTAHRLLAMLQYHGFVEQDRHSDKYQLGPGLLQLGYSYLDLNELREKIGFVTQDTQLFSGTIRENLLFVRPEATDEECLEVLQKAACQSLLARADKGLDTVIGEGGVKVSGGEKQRLSIARALLRQPDILVFDEATSSLDSLTEEEITETIREVSEIKDQITIMIAHRLSTVRMLDRILVFEQGRVVEEGRHDDLVRRTEGTYKRLFERQALGLFVADSEVDEAEELSA